MTEESQDYDVGNHILSPLHEKLSDEEVGLLLKQYNVQHSKLPKISLSDPSVDSLDIKSGDVIKITRPSSTSGTTVYYRMVIDL